MYDEYSVNSSTGGKPYRHEGEECAFILNKGDFIWFDSSLPHKIKNLSDKKTIAIWVDFPPLF